MATATAPNTPLVTDEDFFDGLYAITLDPDIVHETTTRFSDGIRNADDPVKFSLDLYYAVGKDHEIPRFSAKLAAATERLTLRIEDKRSAASRPFPTPPRPTRTTRPATAYTAEPVGASGAADIGDEEVIDAEPIEETVTPSASPTPPPRPAPSMRTTPADDTPTTRLHIDDMDGTGTTTTTTTVTDTSNSAPELSGTDRFILVIVGLIGFIVGLATVGPFVADKFFGTDSWFFTLLGAFLAVCWVFFWVVAMVYTIKWVLERRAKKRATETVTVHTRH